MDVFEIKEMAELICKYLNQIDLTRLRRTCVRHSRNVVFKTLLQKSYDFLNLKLSKYYIPCEVFKCNPNVEWHVRSYLINTKKARDPSYIVRNDVEEDITEDHIYDLETAEVYVPGDLLRIYFSKSLNEIGISKWDIVIFKFNGVRMVFDGEGYQYFHYMNFRNYPSTIKKYPPHYWNPMGNIPLIPYDLNELKEYVVSFGETFWILEVDYSFGCKIQYRIDFSNVSRGNIPLGKLDNLQSTGNLTRLAEYLGT